MRIGGNRPAEVRWRQGALPIAAAAAAVLRVSAWAMRIKDAHMHEWRALSTQYFYSMAGQGVPWPNPSECMVAK